MTINYLEPLSPPDGGPWHGFGEIHSAGLSIPRSSAQSSCGIPGASTRFPVTSGVVRQRRGLENACGKMAKHCALFMESRRFGVDGFYKSHMTNGLNPLVRCLILVHELRILHVA